MPATYDHPYISRKQGKPDGLRVYPSEAPPLMVQGKNLAGYLVVPCWSEGGLQTMQFIPPEKGDKLNLPGASFDNGFFTLDEMTNFVYICEGIGQSWAINRAMKVSTVVCFGAHRMMGVAKILREKYPDARLVIVSDRGKEKQAAEIAKTVSGCWVEMPQNKPSNYDVNDYAIEFGTNKLIALLGRAKTPELRYKLLSGADLCNTSPMRWMMRGVLPAEGLSALYGASGSGKSFLVLDMAFAIAGGDKYWFGHRISQFPVTYVCLEGAEGMRNRIRAWSLYCKRHIPNKLHFIVQPFDILTDDVTELSKAVNMAGGASGLVIIDTLNRAAPGADENSSVDMGKIIAAAKRLQNLTSGLVLLVHHCGKDATKGLRGHSSLYAALDSAIEVVKTDARREWCVAKSKDDVTGNKQSFKLEIVPVYIDDEGEQVTSCVALFDESIDNSVRRTLPPKSGNQKRIWEALSSVFLTSIHLGQGGAPAGTPCVRFEEAVEKTRGYLVCEQKRQTERAQSAISGLVMRGLLEHQEGWLWMV